MTRETIYKKLVNYFHNNVNCRDIVKNLLKNPMTTLGNGLVGDVFKLNIDGVDVALKIIKYNADPNYKHNTRADMSDTYIANTNLHVFDEMSKLDKTYFPYIYAVFHCRYDNENDYHQNDNYHNVIYVFMELFDGDVRSLIRDFTSTDEWLDLCFQMVLINYYLLIQKKYVYTDAKLRNFLFKKLPKPVTKEYTVDDTIFKITHYNDIVFADPSYLNARATSKRRMKFTNIDNIINHLNLHNDIPIKPPAKLIALMKGINSHPKYTVQLLSRMYNSCT